MGEDTEEMENGGHGLVKKLLALFLGAVAARAAVMAVEQVWTRGFRQELPDLEEEATSLLRKVAWVGLVAAAVAMAREAAQQLATSRSD